MYSTLLQIQNSRTNLAELKLYACLLVTLHFPLALVPGNHHSPDSVNLSNLDASYKWQKMTRLPERRALRHSRSGLKSEDWLLNHEKATLGKQATHLLERINWKICVLLWDIWHIAVIIMYTKELPSSVTKDLVWCPETQRKRPSSHHKWSYPSWDGKNYGLELV